MPTDNDRKRLRELAETATPGEWIAVPPHHSYRAAVGVVDNGRTYTHAHALTNSDAAFIAAANPAAVLSLLDQLEAVERECEQAVSHKVELNKMLGEAQQALAASQQETERLRRVIEDAAPMMMTVTAFGADEADKNGLAEMARWYVEQERDYSSFDVWLDAHRDREKRNKEGGVEP